MPHAACLLSAAHALLEQPVLQREIGHDLLQGTGQPAQALDLVRGRGPGGVAGEPRLAGFQEPLGPAAGPERGDAFAPAEPGDAPFAPQALQRDAPPARCGSSRRKPGDAWPAGLFFRTLSAGALLRTTCGPVGFILAPGRHNEPNLLREPDLLRPQTIPVRPMGAEPGKQGAR